MPIQISTPSVQSLKVATLARGNVLAHATATVAKLPHGQPYLLTNRHVVTGRDNNTGKCLDKTNAAIPDTLRVWCWMHELPHQRVIDIPLYSGGEVGDSGIAAWTVHPSYPEADVVALPLLVPDEVQLTPYELSNGLAENLIEPGDHVHVIGFPLSEKNSSPFGIWVAGFVASEPQLNHQGSPYFLIDCRARKGQSGSPVIVASGGHGLFKQKNERHFNIATKHLLGLYSGRLGSDTDLGMVWKAWLLCELLVYAQALHAQA